MLKAREMEEKVQGLSCRGTRCGGWQKGKRAAFLVSVNHYQPSHPLLKEWDAMAYLYLL